MRRSRGFTLIELVIALSIFALIASGLVVTLRNGIRTWHRLIAFSESQGQLRFAVQLLARDAAQANLLTGRNDVLPIFGEQELRFVSTYRDPASGMLRLQHVAWHVRTTETGEQELVRVTAPYPALVDSLWGRTQVMITAVEAVTFRYATIDVNTQVLSWLPLAPLVDDGFPLALPRGVRMILQVQGAATDIDTFDVEIPIGVRAIAGADS
jgi:prepilin-type N-terminal cleavage/methylation domain-containing protein